MHIQGFTQQSITQGQALNILKNQLDIDTNKDIEISVFEEKVTSQYRNSTTWDKSEHPQL